MDVYRGVEMTVSEKLHTSAALTPNPTPLKDADTRSVADILAAGLV
jgi:hypothetical protein